MGKAIRSLFGPIATGNRNRQAFLFQQRDDLVGLSIGELDVQHGSIGSGLIGKQHCTQLGKFADGADDLSIKRFELLRHIQGQQELVVADENSKVAASRLCQNMNPLTATLLPGENPPYHIG